MARPGIHNAAPLLAQKRNRPLPAALAALVDWSKPLPAVTACMAVGGGIGGGGERRRCDRCGGCLRGRRIRRQHVAGEEAAAPMTAMRRHCAAWAISLNLAGLWRNSGNENGLRRIIAIKVLAA
jgi:hypothetical protein